MAYATNSGMNARGLDELVVYRKALAACNAVSALAARPNLCKDCELRKQLTSASGSVPANIAEGFGQQTDRQFARYLYLARGSCQETRAHLTIAQGRLYLSQAEAKNLLEKYEEIAKMLTGLIKYLHASDRKHRG